MDGFNFAYDPFNRLIAATGPRAVYYEYDAYERRKQKTVDGVITRTLWLGEEELGEYSDNGGLLRRYIPLGGVDRR